MGPGFRSTTGREDPILGRIDHYEKHVPRITVKGNLVASRARYVRERWGEQMHKSIAEKLSEKARRFFDEAPLSFDWCAYEPLVEIDYRIVEIAMENEVPRMKEFGAAIAGYDLPFAYKVLFKVGTPSFVVSRFPSAFRAYMRPGAIGILDSDSKSARVSLSEAIYPRYMCEFGISGWIRKAVELSGGTLPVSNHVACAHRGDPSCEYQVNWR